MRQHPSSSSKSSRHGSIYVLTLLTVAAVGSMILIGAKLRSSSNSGAQVIEDMNANSTGVLDAAELAIGQIKNDTSWKVNAQKGVVFSDFTLGDRDYSSSVIDADTLAVPTLSTSIYRVQVESQHGIVQEQARFDLNASTVDYLAFLKGYGLELYWPLNEATTSTTAEEIVWVAPITNGTYLDPNGAGQETNDEGGIVPVFGSIGDHVEVPWSNSFIASDGTFSLWMKYTGPNRSFINRPFLGMECALNGNTAFNVCVYYSSLWFYIDDDDTWGAPNLAITGSNTIMANQWYHIAVSWGSAGQKVYIDGKLAGSTAANTDGLDSATKANGGRQPLMIGGGENVNLNTTPMTYFDGSVAHVAMMTSQLSDAQVAEIAAVKPDLYEFSLVEGSWVRVYD